MTWVPDASVTINGVNYDSKSLAGIQVSFGRQTIWEQPRAGYAVVNILNLTNSDFAFQPNQSVVITMNNSAGTPITIFTGKITDINNSINRAGASLKDAIQQITAVSSLANMSRVNLSGSFPKEFDNDRMTSIINAAGVTTDTIDIGVYEFQSVTASTSDTYTLGTKYSQMAFGYLYDTPDGKIGWANESRRFNDVTSGGYYSLNKSYLMRQNLTSSKNLTNLLNDVILSYRAGSVTSSDATSQASYGLAAGTISTELHNLADAQLQADRYITLRATPRTNIGQLSIQLDNPNMTDADRNFLIGMNHGKAIQVTNLPTAIKNSTYRAFVEGWTLIIGKAQAAISLITSDATLSIVPTRWQDVSASLQWSGVGALVQWDTYDD